MHTVRMIYGIHEQFSYSDLRKDEDTEGVNMPTYIINRAFGVPWIKQNSASTTPPPNYGFYGLERTREYT